jgi:hypothetical protein
MSVNEPSKIDKTHTSGPLQAHEFAHTFQTTQFLGTAKESNTYCCVKQYLPWWSVEGGAHFVEGSAMNTDSYEDYKAWIKKTMSDFKGYDKDTFTKAWFENFLQPPSTSLWGTEPYRWKIYSGGALVDSQGRIIGVNSAIATLTSGGTSGSIGLGFSIPINEAKRVIEEIIATGKSTRPVMGVVFDDVTAETQAKILQLTPGEGAQKAGIVVGSIITSIDGVKISNRDAAIVKIRSYAPGAVITVVLTLPDGSSKSYKVTLGTAPAV